MEPPRRRRADDATVRKMQFETARRILFGTDLIPGTDRPMWTSAGFIRPDNVQYIVAFPLGPFTFFLQRIAMSNTILVFVHMNNHVHEFPSRSDYVNDTRSASLIIQSPYVAIGVLKEDSFFPITPNFLNTTAVRVFADNEEEYLSMADGRLFILSIDGGKVMAGVSFNISGYFSDLVDEDEDSESEINYYITHETEFHVFQMAADDDEMGNLGPLLGAVSESEPVEQQMFLIGEGKTDAGTVVKTDYTINRFNDFIYDIEFEIPFQALQNFFDVDIPQEFIESTIDGNDFDYERPCVFTNNVTTTGRGHGIYAETLMRSTTQQRSVWKAGDMLAVAYAQSLLVHVLGGPDPRKFRPDPDNTLPMKETREPESLFRFRLDKERDVYCYEMLGAYPGGSTDFISFQARVRFFQESLTTKTSRALLRELGVGTPSFPEKLNIVATANRDVLFMITNAMENIQRFKKQEFLGQKCHVCFENEAKFHVKDTGLKVCSKTCHNTLKKGH